MKKSLIILSIAAAMTAAAQGAPAPADTIAQLESRVTATEIAVKTAREEAKALRSEVADSLAARQEKMAALDARVTAVTAKLDEAIDSVNSRLGTEITTTRDTIDSVRSETSSMLTYIIIAIIAVAAALGAAYFILRKKVTDGSLDLKSIREANRKLEEQSVALDNKLTQLFEQQLSTAEKVEKVASQSAEPDHSLVLAIANEMARIQQNLAFMDPKTKGVSQLRNRAVAIEDSLRKKGYEIEQLVGTEYRDGMNMEVVMEEDPSIDSARMIIRRVSRPAVSYKGKMIQAASVVVGFNPDFEE